MACDEATRKCEFWTWSEDAVRPECCTRLLMRLAARVHRELETRQIRHWLDYGALLGAVRDGHLVPWDDDVDFGYFAEDRDRVEEILRAGDGSLWHYDPKLNWETHFVVTVSAANKLNVDLYSWSARDGIAVGTWQAEELWSGRRIEQSFPLRFLERLEPVTLEGTSFPAPSPADEFLIGHRYGPDYMTPTRGPTIVLRGSYPADESIPALGDLLDTLASRQRKFFVLASRSGVRHDSWRGTWRRAGRPVRPRAEYFDRALALVPAGDRGRRAHDLAVALAITEQAIEEIEHPSPSLYLRRPVRRLWRVWRAGAPVRAVRRLLKATRTR